MGRRSWIIALFAAVTAVKVVLAARLELFGDEAFYWQESERLAFAYADHPPLTALLVRAGTELLGDTPLGVRALFLLAGAPLPLAVAFLARPLVGARDAWWAAAACLALPGLGLNGLIAIPDVLLLLFVPLMAGSLERATRTGALGWWVALGLVAALGLATHYRFSVPLLGGALFFLATRRGRALLRTKGPWIAVALTLPGLAPAVAINLELDWAPLRYYLEGRHDGRFQLEGLGRFLSEQAAIVGPVTIVALLAAGRACLRRARAGDDRAALCACLAAVPLGLYLVASPLETSKLPTVHWPLPGYLPLLPFLPATLRAFLQRGSTPWRRFAVRAVPGFGLLVLAFGFFELGSPRVLTDLRFRQFHGATQAAAAVTPLLAEVARGGARPLLFVDDYVLGGQLEFLLHRSADVYVLEHKVNRRHGRAPQLALWGIDAQALGERTDRAGVVVVAHDEDGDERGWRKQVASHFARLEPAEVLRFAAPSGRDHDKVLRIFRCGPAATAGG